MVTYTKIDDVKCKSNAIEFLNKLNCGNIRTIIMKADFGKTIVVNYYADRSPRWILIGEDGIRDFTTDKLIIVIETMEIAGTISEVQFVER